MQRKIKSVNAFILHTRREGCVILLAPAGGRKTALRLGVPQGAGRSAAFAATGVASEQGLQVYVGIDRQETRDESSAVALNILLCAKDLWLQ